MTLMKRFSTKRLLTMKHHQNLLLSIFTLSLLNLMQCKKDQPIIISSNIVLKDKPLEVIKAHIAGKWALNYEKGGICNACPPVIIDSNITDFNKGDLINVSLKGSITLNAPITWKHEKDVYQEMTYTLNYQDDRGYDYHFIVNGITNDTLRISDNAFDPVSYYYSRIK
jgi:hypothetical protein